NSGPQNRARLSSACAAAGAGACPSPSGCVANRFGSRGKWWIGSDEKHSKYSQPRAEGHENPGEKTRRGGQLKSRWEIAGIGAPARRGWNLALFFTLKEAPMADLHLTAEQEAEARRLAAAILNTTPLDARIALGIRASNGVVLTVVPLTRRRFCM